MKLVIGSGPTGLRTAELLAEAGATVTVVSRRGPTSEPARYRHLALDVNDVRGLTEVARGASTIFNCAMPRYDRWPEEFPPIGAAVLEAARQSGADVVTLSNVYGYGPTEKPFVESMPLAPTTRKGRVRAGMWEAALASSLRVTEVRASDYLGYNAVSLFTLAILSNLLARQPAQFPGDLDAPHSWSFTSDVARTLVAASRSDESWGRAWHVPSNTLSARELSSRTAQLAGIESVSLSRLPMTVLEELGRTDSLLHEVVEMAYLFDRPCLIDSRETEQALNVRATPVDAVLRDMLRT